MSATSYGMSGAATMRRARVEGCGFLSAAELAAIAADNATRLELILVRCGSCRFLAPAQDVAYLIAIITADGRDYVRDVSLPAERTR